MIDEEIKALIDTAMAETRNLLTVNQDKLKALAGALLRYETLNADEVQKILDGKALDKPTVGDLLDRELARSNESGGAAQPGDLPPPPE